MSARIAFIGAGKRRVHEEPARGHPHASRSSPTRDRAPRHRRRAARGGRGDRPLDEWSRRRLGHDQLAPRPAGRARGRGLRRSTWCRSGVHEATRARLRDPAAARSPPDDRRHARDRRHLPGAAHDPGHARDRRGHGRASAPTRGSSTTRTRWRCSAGRSTRARRSTASSASATPSSTRHARLAELVDVPFEEVTFLGAGINHQSFILRFERDGERPLSAARRGDRARPRARAHRARARCTGGSATSRPSRPSTARSTCRGSCGTTSSSSASGSRSASTSSAARRTSPSTSACARALARGEGFEIERSLEYASLIIHSIETGVERVIYGNVRNDGLIDNLPDGCCVEVPCIVDRTGVQADARRRPAAAARCSQSDVRERRASSRCALPWRGSASTSTTRRCSTRTRPPRSRSTRSKPSSPSSARRTPTRCRRRCGLRRSRGLSDRRDRHAELAQTCKLVGVGIRIGDQFLDRVGVDDPGEGRVADLRTVGHDDRALCPGDQGAIRARLRLVMRGQPGRC